jgi:hypothetical protein
MKKVLIVMVALLAMVAFVSGAIAQKADAPAAKADKAKADKPKAPKASKAVGTVVAYEAGKTIKVKAKDKELAFDIAADAKITGGEVKEGGKVTVTYKKDGDKNIATAIAVAAAKKPKAKKEEKK